MKNLRKFVEQQNLMAKLFGQKPLDVDNLSAEDRTKLADQLENALSPENLCCDGELRGRALQTKANMLNGALRELKSL